MSWSAAIFAVVFYLHDVPLVALSYALLLCGVVLTLALGCGFVLWRRRHLALADKLKSRDADGGTAAGGAGPGGGGLPDPLPGGAQEQDAGPGPADQQEKELTEYYTLWVHQIKTPISAMRLLLQGEDTDLSRELEAQLFRINQYVEMVLAYLRMAARAGTMCCGPVPWSRW